MGVWCDDMYQVASEIGDDNIHTFTNEVFGGQHYFEGVLGACEMVPKIREDLANRNSAMYSFGFVTAWNECLYLDRQLSSKGGYIHEIPIKDVGIAVGVGVGYQDRYPLRPGTSYRQWAEEHFTTGNSIRLFTGPDKPNRLK
jgi:hypothetical protein